jgi:hypothetical protein
MSKVIHTQGLWEIVPEGDAFKIITTASDQIICTVNKREDAALIVCSSVMFSALCIAVETLEKETASERAKNIAKMLRKLIRQANAETEEVKYGAIAYDGRGE